MVLKKLSDLNTETQPLELVEIARPVPVHNQILIRISCCGVCHTELDEIEGRTPPSSYPVIPGHQVVGYVAALGPAAGTFNIGARVGVAWIFHSCGQCDFCYRGLENLCDQFKATGRDADGGYAEYMVVAEQFAYPVPEVFSDVEAAPLFCAGAIGYRSLKLTNFQDGQTLGLTGFGASGHLVLKLAKYLYPQSNILVFARSIEERKFALSLGARWAGDTSETPPFELHAMIDTTPAWEPIVKAMENLRPGGRLVINAIRKEKNDQQILLDLQYQDHLWMEKEIKSVANITRDDVREFLAVAAVIPIRSVVEVYPLEQANKALLDLKHKHVKGAKVLQMDF